MRPRIVTTIAKKELVESFRDRRTLFLMIFLPILLYPVLILVVTQVAMVQQSRLAEQRSQVAYLHGSDQHPLIAHLAGDALLELTAVEAGAVAPPIDDESVHAIVDLSAWPADHAAERLEVTILYESTSELSRQASDRLETALADFERAETERRLGQAGVPDTRFASIIEPVSISLDDRSPPARRGGYALGSILPLLVIATVLLGAYYPAIDLTAGEKERGSIQTLFTAPITPFEIVAGKYVAVLGIALVSGMANLISMALLFSQNLFIAGDAFGDVDFSIPPLVLGALFVDIVLMAMFFASLLLTVAVLARSYKEGQNYITPVYLACFIPIIIAQMPGFELTPQLALVPAVNVTLLMKQLLVDGIVLESLFVVGVSTVVYTAMVLVVASRLFAQEQVILGERGRFELLERRRIDEADRRPRLGEGLGLYGVAFVMLFYLGSVLQSLNLVWGLLATLWLLLLLPSVGLARFLRLDLRQTFHLRRPDVRSLVAAVLLGLCAWIVVAGLNSLIDEHVLRTPPELGEAFYALVPDGPLAWVGLLFVIAISPAICEEAVFRGFLFSSFRQRMAPWAVIGLTALLFGLFHLSIYRLFGTTALGLVMGLLVYKSGSIYTSAIFHALSNGAVLVMLAGYGEGELASATLPGWLLASGAVGTALGLLLLWTVRSPWRAGSMPADPAQNMG